MQPGTISGYVCPSCLAWVEPVNGLGHQCGPGEVAPAAKPQSLRVWLARGRECVAMRPRVLLVVASDEADAREQVRGYERLVGRGPEAFDVREVGTGQRGVTRL